MKKSTQSVSEDHLLETAFDWLERVQAEGATDADQQALEMWRSQSYLHEDALERARIYEAAFESLKPEDIEANLLRPLAIERRKNLTRRFISWLSVPTVQMAAAVLAIAVISFSFAANYLSVTPAPVNEDPILLAYETGLGEIQTVSLSDGSAVTLDSKTSMTVEFTDEIRKVTLNIGAAHFDVASEPDRPFVVLADDLTATVKGTAFDIRNNAGVQRVGVAEGLVEVSYPYVLNGQPSQLSTLKRLAAGERVFASIDAGISNKSTLDPSRVGLWRDQILFYERAPLKEMIADANRFSDREIVLSELIEVTDKTVSGSFRTDDIDGMLAMISMTFDVSIDESHPERITLTPAS